MELANTLPGDLSNGPVVDLVEVVVRCRLLDPVQTAEVAGPLAARFPAPRLLARELIQRGWLTPYQVNQLFNGKALQLLLGSYVLLERLGEGGMGQVFKARHQTLGRVAALKVIRKDRLANAQVLSRFRREIQAVAQLSHPNVVIAFDADFVGETHFFSMEYVEGNDLGKVVKSQGAQPFEKACDWIRQAALGLQHAHERGLIHRDIKPSNLLLTNKGNVVKVLDLGLARLQKPDGEDSSSGDTLTSDGSLMGTPDFIAPEQARNSHTADARSDLYSLGCTFFYVLTGQAPFPGETSTEKLYKHWFEEPRPVESLRPEIPPPVGAVVRRLLAKRPEDRFQTARDLAAALTPPIGVSIASLMPAMAIQAPVPPSATANLPTALPLTTLSDRVNQAIRPTAIPAAPGRKRPSRIAVGFAGVAALVLLTVVIRLAMRPDTSPNARATGATRGGLTERVTGADADMSPLAARYRRPSLSPDEEKTLRQDLLAFRKSHPGSPPALRAADMLSRLASPLDGRKPSAAEVEGFSKVPIAVVLGERKRRHWGPARLAAFSADGRTLATSGPQDGIRVWNTRTGVEALHIECRPLQALAFSTDGKTLLTARDDGKAMSYDLSNGKPLTTTEAVAPTASMALAPGAELVAAGMENGSIHVSPLGSSQDPLKLDGHKGRVTALAFAPDGKRLASGGADQTVRLWDVASGKLLTTLEGHAAAVRCLAFSPDGQRLASGSDDTHVKVWEGAPVKAGLTLASDGNTGPVSALVFVENGKRLAIGTAFGPVRLWGLNDDDPRELPDAHFGLVGALAWSEAEKSLASVGREGSVRLWDIRKEEERDPLIGHAAWLSAAVFSPDGQLATAGGDQLIYIWDPTQPGQPLKTLTGHQGPIGDLAFTADGKRLLAGDWDGAIKDWDVAKGKERDPMTGQRGRVMSLAVSADGKTLASGNHFGEAKSHLGEVRVGDLAGRREGRTYKVHKHAVTALALPADGQVVYTGSRDGTVKMITPLTGTEIFALKGDTPIGALALHPAGGLLAVGDGAGGLKLYDVSAKSLVLRRSLEGHKTAVTALAFSPDGQHLVSADADGSVALWPSTGGRYLEAHKLPGQVNGVSFAPDGRHVATANANGTAFILRLVPRRPRE